jgi:hypothetical protein
MIFSMQLADVGAAGPKLLRRTPDPQTTDGLRYALMFLRGELTPRFINRPRPTHLALFAAWDDDAAFERFEAEHPLGRRLAGDENRWSSRLHALRVFGAWPPHPELTDPGDDGDDDEPAAVLTLGRLMPSQTIRFLRASAPAEKAALEHPGLIAATALARPPFIVSTFSVWRTIADLVDYSRGASPDAHRRAARTHHEQPFHSSGVFVRFRPYATRGAWAEVQTSSSSSASSADGGPSGNGDRSASASTSSTASPSLDSTANR